MSARPCILVTRPEPDATRTARLLQEAGYDALCSPVVTVTPKRDIAASINQLIKENTQAIALTSKRGFDGLMHLPQVKHFPVFVVGSASAATARELGFDNVIEGEGNAASLVQTIIAHCNPNRGHILYVRGRNVSIDVAGQLKEHGFSVAEVISYSVTPMEQLREDVVQNIRNGNIHAVATYSQYSYAYFTVLARKHGISDALAHIDLVCLSPKIATMATNEPRRLWQKVVHADTPEEAAMLEAFKRLYGEPPRITTGT